MEVPKGVEFGQPKGLKAGGPDAFWVWLDKDGWHVRTTAPASPVRQFTGRIWVSEGKIADTKFVRTELLDRTRSGVNFVEFDFDTAGGIDGFDFKAPGAKCVRFKLMYEGAPANRALVNIGEKQVHPERVIFSLCPP